MWDRKKWRWISDKTPPPLPKARDILIQTHDGTWYQASKKTRKDGTIYTEFWGHPVILLEGGKVDGAHYIKGWRSW